MDKDTLIKLLDLAEVDEDVWKEIQEILKNHIGDYEGGMREIYNLFEPLSHEKEEDDDQ